MPWQDFETVLVYGQIAKKVEDLAVIVGLEKESSKFSSIQAPVD